MAWTEKEKSRRKHRNTVCKPIRRGKAVIGCVCYDAQMIQRVIGKPKRVEQKGETDEQR